MVVTGHVLREINQVSAGGGCPSRPWRARAKSDLQLGGPANCAAPPPTCQGALALSGVLRRLQLVEEKILQVKASPCALFLPVSGEPSIPPLPLPSWAGFLILPFEHALSPAPCPALSPACYVDSETCLSHCLQQPTILLSVTTSFFFLLSCLDCRRGLRTWPTGNSTKRTLRRRRLTLPPCLDMGISHR